MLHAHEVSTPAFGVDWKELVAIEPELAKLYEEVCSLKDPGGRSFCAEAVWHRQLKARLTWLVGFRAHGDDPRLRSMAAYDIAFETVYGALPPCRGCGCLE
jgi:hypothetical protein